MTDQKARAQAFHALHVKGDPLVLFNMWDVGSAKAVAESGAKALATGSWSVAAAQGFPDGEFVPLHFVVENLRRITQATTLPVSLDFESGYGKTLDELGASVTRVIEAGAVGCNFEDGIAGGKMRDVAEQAQRIARVRAAADAADVPFFINARTDLFLQAPKAAHDDALVDAAIARGAAYAAAGADGLFVPGLIDARLLARVVSASTLPVNVMMAEGAPALAKLAELGVARVSHGPGPYRAAMKFLREAAAKALER